MSAPLPLPKRFAVFVRDRGAYVYCGATYQASAKLTVEHAASRKRGGGGDGFDNLVAACRSCNIDKAHSALAAAGLTASLLVDHREDGQPLSANDLDVPEATVY